MFFKQTTRLFLQINGVDMISERGGSKIENEIPK